MLFKVTEFVVIGYGGGDRQLLLKARKGLREESGLCWKASRMFQEDNTGQQAGEAGQGTITAAGEDV